MISNGMKSFFNLFRAAKNKTKNNNINNSINNTDSLLTHYNFSRSANLFSKNTSKFNINLFKKLQS